jgi:Tfp pilus assembly ATPase PilU
MQSFDQDILRLVQTDQVTIEEAFRWVTNVEEFKMRLRGITSGSAADASKATLAAAAAGAAPASPASSVTRADVDRFGR